MWLDDLGQIAYPASVRSVVGMWAEFEWDLVAWVLVGGAVPEHIDKASEGLLPGDKTLILNRKEKKDYFLESEFSIDKLWKVLDVFLHP